jgi:rare lipoprotein A
MLGMTAAHKTLPLPTYVEVTNLKNNRHIIVKVNDRGPFESSRLIDLSYVAAKKLGMIGHGTAQVKIKAIDPSTWSKTDNMWMASNDTNRGADFAGSPMPLKRTYTYYLQDSHHLTGAAPVSTASTAPARRTYAYSAPASRRMKTRAMFAQNSLQSHADSYRTRLARTGKSRQHYANHSIASKHSAREMQNVYFQVGAFRSKQNAQQLQRRLTAQLGAPVNISRPSNKAKLYHVRIGPIRDIAVAKRLTNRLKNLGIKSNKQYGV